MKKYIFYIIYNVTYQLGSFFFFFYANTFINEGLVPDSLSWRGNEQRLDFAGLSEAAIIKTLALLVEATVLILVIYFINKLILSDTEPKDRRNAISKRTAKINMVVSIIFIAILIWGSFRGFLW